MSGKKGDNDGKKLKAPKVELDPAFSDDEPEPPKISYASSDSGAYSQDDPSVRKKDDKDSSSQNLEIGECSGYKSPDTSPSKGKGSKSPIMKIKAGAGKVCKAVAAGLRSISPSKKKGLTDEMEEEYEKPETKSPKSKSSKSISKLPKRISKKLSLETQNSDSDVVDSGVTTISSLPDSDQTSFDEKSDNFEGDKDSFDDPEEE